MAALNFGLALSPLFSHQMTPIRSARSVVQEIVSALHKESFRRKVGIEVTEVFEGGSLGHGTTVEDKFDIDIVLYSRSLTVEDAVKNGYEDYFIKIDSYLREELGGRYCPEDDHTDVAIKFAIKQVGGGSSIDVDLILSPFFEDQDELLSSLQTVAKSKRLKMFSASASKWQTDFIRHQPQWVKMLITRVKAWKNIHWKDDNDGRPKSYLLSNLVIIAYERLPAGMRIPRKRGLKKLIKRMTAEFKALVREIEADRHLDLSIPGADKDLQDSYHDLLPDPPRIIDPVNPANNLYLSGITRCKGKDKWEAFERKIEDLDLSPAILREHKQLFKKS